MTEGGGQRPRGRRRATRPATSTSAPRTGPAAHRAPGPASIGPQAPAEPRTVAPAPDEPRTVAPVPDEAPVLPRSKDDQDVGWGGAPERDDDDRILREVPPHWQ